MRRPGNPACVAGNVIKSVTHSATGDVLSGIAQAITDGVTWIVTNTATWWLRIPSPDLAGEPAVSAIQRWLLPVTGGREVGITEWTGGSHRNAKAGDRGDFSGGLFGSPCERLL